MQCITDQWIWILKFFIWVIFSCYTEITYQSLNYLCSTWTSFSDIIGYKLIVPVNLHICWAVPSFLVLFCISVNGSLFSFNAFRFSKSFLFCLCSSVSQFASEFLWWHVSLCLHWQTWILFLVEFSVRSSAFEISGSAALTWE